MYTFVRAMGVGGAALLAAAPSVAQQPPPSVPGTVEPGKATNPNQLQQAPKPPEAKLQFSFPAQRKSTGGKSSDDLKFPVKRVLVEGATIVGPDFWDPLIAPLLTRRISLPEVVAVADAIQARYVAKGYPLTRAFVPPQEIEDGTVRIKVVEGYVGKVQVDGASPDTAERLKDFLAPPQAERPTRAATIERSLLLAGDLPGVVVGGVLRPGDQPGMAELALTVTETPYAVSVGGGNRNSRFAGPWTFFADAAANSALGWGEQIGLTASATPDLSESRSLALRYLQPVNADGLSLATTLNYSRGRPGAGLQTFAVRTTSMAAGQRLSWPLLRTRRQNLVLEAGWTAQEARIDLLGERFSTDVWRTADFRVSFSEAGFLGGGTVLTAALVQGLDVLNATPAGSMSASRLDPDPRFTKLSAEMQRLQALPKGALLVIGVAGQYTRDVLFSGEEFGLGGARFGRGYNASDLSGGNGFGATAELRRTFQFEMPYLASATPYAFFDWGRVWRSETANTLLRSAGGGVRLDFAPGRSATLEVARPLRNLPVPGAQDPGTRFYLELAASL
ncbi:MAG TPA: ShlB/FhaC/HecB family hemolysin secretion/activation protein [Azospirillaceae bacterium]|nr:ShlB/FhaC/HecB family hemolysin secretion/activation protein [Azospirillaceae bacterium]